MLVQDQAAVGARSRQPGWRPLHIAMIGQKGLPATFGGIEHHVEEIGRRLAARGHTVTVFCRRSYGEVPQSPYLGMQIRVAPTVGSKHLDAIVHSGTSTVMAMASSCDVVHYHALGPGLLAPLPRYLSRAATVLTVHGLDHQRGKWGRLAKTILGAAHWMSGRVPDRTVVVSRELARHYLDTFERRSDYIPNGVDAPQLRSPQRSVSHFGLIPQDYLLFVGRLVPEKAPDALLRAYRDVPGSRRLVVVGDSSFSDDYTQLLKDLAAADPRVLLTGFIFGSDLGELYRHAGLFVQPSLLEGLPLTLLEAASYGVPVLASDIPPHREVLGDSSRSGRRLFTTGDEDALRAALTTAVAELDDRSEATRLASSARNLRDEVLAGYDWDRATDELERVYLEQVGAIAPVSQSPPVATRDQGRGAS